MPHLLHVATSGADPSKNVPIGFWMHRGCVPFINHEQFKQFYWPTLKPIILEIIRQGWQVLFYAEGKWAAHLDAFAELPDAGIVLHVDQDNIFEVHKKVGHKFCLSGGIPNFMLAYEKPEKVREFCKRIIREVASDGGYIADASAIMANEASIENVKVMTDTFREYGVY
jgi:uroporphyrinogen-III decarboxylase